MSDTTVTRLLQRMSAGEPGAAEALAPLVYRELKRVAHRQLRRERDGHTLNTTALVHEAWLRLGPASVDWQDRTHFFAVAARAMRRVLIDYAAARGTAKRGGGAVPVEVSEALPAPARPVDDWLALDQALTQLEALDARQARVVECHAFAGMSLDETAAALGVSPATVSRDWALARAWLNQALSRHRERADGSDGSR